MAINYGTVQSHQHYCSDKGFGFPILSDPEASVAKAFKCFNVESGGIIRTVYGLDVGGKIIFAERGKAIFDHVLMAIEKASS